MAKKFVAPPGNWQFGVLKPLLPEGIPPKSMVVVAGSPGTGKTILCSELIYTLAKGERALWFTTFSETQSKLVSHLKAFEFFDPKKISFDAPVSYIDLAASFRAEQSFAGIMALIEREIAKQKPSLIVVDSIRQIQEWAEVAKDGFRALAELPLFLWQATSFLIGEYGEDDLKTNFGFFALADGIIYLSFEREGFLRRRYIEALKMRGVPFAAGKHPARISAKGYRIFATDRLPEPPIASRERVGTGVAGLDVMLQGGVLKASSVFVEGPSGTGKTILGMHFLDEGLKNKENVLYVSLEEGRAQVLRNAALLGFDFEKAEAEGRFTLLRPEYEDVSPEEVFHQIQEAFGATRPARIFFDSITYFPAEPERWQNIFQWFSALLKREGVTALFAAQSGELLAPTRAAGFDLSTVADAIILLKYVEAESQLKRALSVIKIRGSGHDKTVREFVITSKGIRTALDFGGYSGLMSGVASKTAFTTGEALRSVFREVLGSTGEVVFQKFGAGEFLPEDIKRLISELGSRGGLSTEQTTRYLRKMTNLLGE